MNFFLVDMESAGQAVYTGMPWAAPVGEGIHSLHCSSLATTDPGPVGEECWEDQSRRQAEPWPPWALVCGSKQTSQHQSRCSSVSNHAGSHVKEIQRRVLKVLENLEISVNCKTWQMDIIQLEKLWKPL